MEQFKILPEPSPYLEMPEIESHQYLIDWLFDAGPLMLSSMGNSPLTSQELFAWGKDIDITPWEVATIKTLSIDYAVTLQNATEKSMPAPYKGEVDEKYVKQDGERIKNMFMRLANNGGKSGTGRKQ